MFLWDEHASLFVNNTPKKFYNIVRRKLTAIKCKKKISEKVKNWRKNDKRQFWYETTCDKFSNLKSPNWKIIAQKEAQKSLTNYLF
jgi:hypothetical protein